MDEGYIERRIVTGFIVSADYISLILSIWDAALLASPEAAMLTTWCLEYYEKYRKAPQREIDAIFTAKMPELTDTQIAALEEIINSMGEEYDHDSFNADYLADQTKTYLKERNIQRYKDRLDIALERNNYLEAETLLAGFKPIVDVSTTALAPFTISPSELNRIFNKTAAPIMKMPGVLGEMMNDHLIRSGFIAFLGSAKVGKTSMLLECAFKALKSRCNVAFFQAGDMTYEQQVKRFAVYLANKSNKAKYCRKMLVPLEDCWLHQNDICDNRNRANYDDIPFESMKRKDYEKQSHEAFMTAFNAHPNHRVCRNCRQWRYNGAVWFKEKPATTPLTYKEAYRVIRKMQKRYGKKRLQISTHPNETLSIGKMNALLDIWEKTINFSPDVICLDYADLLIPDPDYARLDFRHQQNKTWQRLRKLSQDRHCLLITATQADAKSYDKTKLLGMTNFSEDRRKIDHVTAMYGLNQTDVQKALGIMQINEIAIREGDFDPKKPVTVLQRLQMGKPYFGSFQTQ